MSTSVPIIGLRHCATAILSLYEGNQLDDPYAFSRGVTLLGTECSRQWTATDERGTLGLGYVWEEDNDGPQWQCRLSWLDTRSGLAIRHMVCGSTVIENGCYSGVRSWNEVDHHPGWVRHPTPAPDRVWVGAGVRQITGWYGPEREEEGDDREAVPESGVLDQSRLHDLADSVLRLPEHDYGGWQESALEYLLGEGHRYWWAKTRRGQLDLVYRASGDVRVSWTRRDMLMTVSQGGQCTECLPVGRYCYQPERHPSVHGHPDWIRHHHPHGNYPAVTSGLDHLDGWYGPDGVDESYIRGPTPSIVSSRAVSLSRVPQPSVRIVRLGDRQTDHPTVEEEDRWPGLLQYRGQWGWCYRHPDGTWGSAPPVGLLEAIWIDSDSKLEAVLAAHRADCIYDTAGWLRGCPVLAQSHTVVSNDQHALYRRRPFPVLEDPILTGARPSDSLDGDSCGSDSDDSHSLRPSSSDYQSEEEDL